MINEFITVLLIAAGVDILGVIVTHRVAEHRRWGYIPRFVCGGLLVIGGFALPAFAVMDVWLAVSMTGVLALIFAVTGITTWIVYDNDHQGEVAAAIEQAEQINKRIRTELE